MSQTGYRLAPESDPTDFHAAGHDGNWFPTEQDARDAIDALDAVGFGRAWVVVPCEGES